MFVKMKVLKFIRKNNNIYLFIYLFIRQLPKSCHRGVGTLQRQGKRREGNKSEKSEEKERDRGREGEIPNPILGH